MQNNEGIYEWVRIKILQPWAIKHVIKMDLSLLAFWFFSLSVIESLWGSLEFNYNYTHTHYNVSHIHTVHYIVFKAEIIEQYICKFKCVKNPVKLKIMIPNSINIQIVMNHCTVY